MPPSSPQDPHHALSSDPSHLLPEHASEEPRKSGGTALRVIVIVLLLVAVGAFIWWRVSANNEATSQEGAKAARDASRATPVQVAVVQQKTMPVYLQALGTVTAYNTVTLHTRVDGQLLQVNFQEGQAVRKGQLLLQIDPAPYQAAVDQAIGTLAKDEANLKNMQAEAERYTALYQAGVVSKESQQLQVSNEGQAQGTIKADQAAIEAAKVNLAYTRIYAPIDGVVGLRQVDPGNIVHAADTTGLVVITQVHPIAIIFTLPEDQLPQVQQAMRGGKKLVVEAYDRSDAHLITTGTLLTIDNQIDTTTGTAKLKAVFDNKDNSLFSNQFVNVRLILNERPNAIVVPTAAISTGTQGDFVYVVNPGPTPKEKLKNLPPPPSGRGKSGSGKSSSSSSSSTTTTTTAADDGAEGASGSTGNTGSTGKKRDPMHVDVQSVHVDFTIGTESVLSPGALHGGEKVVIDGQEKLVDGSPVSISSGKGTKGASGSTGMSSSADTTMPQPNTGSTGSAGASGDSGSTGMHPQAPTPGHHHSSNNGGGTQ